MMTESQFRRECYARWLLAKWRRGDKTKEEVEKWLTAQPDEQHMRDVMRNNKKPG
tara:strand:- start:8 stop:172 length:165 start_codon:yes stop_codon:yes gene_type:complete